MIISLAHGPRGSHGPQLLRERLAAGWRNGDLTGRIFGKYTQESF